MAAEMPLSNDLKNFVRYLLFAVLMDFGINRGRRRNNKYRSSVCMLYDAKASPIILEP